MSKSQFQIRPILLTDNPAVAAIIRFVMTQFGASGPGFAIHDVEVDEMFETYAKHGCAYFVVEKDGAVLGGGGVAPLDGEASVCELRKMYFMPELRGLGAGAALLRHCLEQARELGYARCYLETLTGMDAAQHLYLKQGFKRISYARGNTGHFSCDRFYERDLTEPI
jgi:putative acetyltransferase